MRPGPPNKENIRLVLSEIKSGQHKGRLLAAIAVFDKTSGQKPILQKRHYGHSPDSPWCRKLGTAGKRDGSSWMTYDGFRDMPRRIPEWLGIPYSAGLANLERFL